MEDHGNGEIMDRSLISCVVPAFNSERFVAEAVESILAQSYRPIEVLVVDDGSADGTGDIVRGFGILVQMVDSLGVEAGRPPDDAMNLVIFRQEKLRQIAPVLAVMPVMRAIFVMFA